MPGLEEAYRSRQTRGLEDSSRFKAGVRPWQVGGTVPQECFGRAGAETEQRVTVWVEGVPRIAIMGSRGLEVRGSVASEPPNFFSSPTGQHPFEAGTPPPPPPWRDSFLFGPLQSPMTPNGTRVPKGPPPPDRLEWPDWANQVGEVTGILGSTPVPPPPPLPPGMCRGEMAGAPEPPAKPEEPSRAVTELPDLPGFTPQEGSVLAGDWMTQLTPVVGTLSPTSGLYWSEVLRGAYDLYTRWLGADPVQRLSIKAEANCWVCASPKHVLIEQRLTVLLMRSVPAEIRNELVAVRAMTSMAVLVAVLTRYQPGGPNERANVLAFLVSPERPTTIEGGIGTCRRWLRQLQRAKELNLMLPDATLLIKGADSLLGPVLTRSQQSVFRLNYFRNERKLDYAPTYEAIVAFGQLILAEYELLQHSEPAEPKKPKVNKAIEAEEEGQPKGGKGKQGQGKQGVIESGQGKGARSSGSNKDSGRAPCKYWCITDMGCVKASRCPDVHDKDMLKGTARCWVCSSTQHHKQDCPRLSKDTSEEAVPKAKGGKNKPEPKVKAAKGEEKPTLAPSAQQILQDTAALLKNIRVSKLGQGRESARALLDSGATACMRSASEQELRGLPERVVQLAQGEVRLRVNAGGTLLTHEPVDPIVSLHRLCQIGYRVNWTREGGCRVKGPGNQELRVFTDGGCPEIEREVGLRLIREIEVAYARQVQAVRALQERGAGKVSMREALQALPVDATLSRQYLAQKFPSLPLEVLARIPVVSDYDASRVIWNRRQRRTWLKSQAVALHLFSGPSKKFWQIPRANAHCVCVDIEENLMDDHTYAYLQSLALSGRLAAVFGGPPCKTFSLSRYMPPELPRPVRGRTSQTQWGFEGLSPSEREAIIEDGILMFRMIWLYLIAEAVAEELGKPRPFFGLEQPKDPETWVSTQGMGITKPREGFASCWALQAIQDFGAEHRLHFWHFDQGPLGHEKRKPTTVMSTVPPPPDVLVSGPGHGTPSAKSVETGPKTPWPSSAWAAWAPQLKNIVKREVISALDAWTSVRCKALRDQENFLRHVVQGHLDFRRDCSACLAGAARGARHDRKSVHDAWVLHVDLMGPFLEGSDEHGRVKYVLTGVLTLPDFSRVREAVQESEDIASGAEAAPSATLREQKCPAPLEVSAPLSTLGPPISSSLPPVADTDLEDYEPSDSGEGPEILAIQPEEEAAPETDADRKAVERAQQRWEAAALALQLKECPVLELPFIRHLPDKSQATVAQGLLAMIAQVTYEGFMIRRGREFNNTTVHRLCRQRDIYQTFTQGDDPQQNGRVEAFHARLKGKTRTLLLGAGASPQDWPYAMRTAHAAMLSHAMLRLGRQTLLPLPFGTQVRVRTRSWERDLWSERVQDAVVLAPSMETCKGHVVRTSSGTLMHTTAVFRGVARAAASPVARAASPLQASGRFVPLPRSAPEGPEVTLSFPGESAPSRRLVGKQSPVAAADRALKVGPVSSEAQALSSSIAALLSHRPVPFRTASALLASAPALWDCARPLPPRLSASSTSKYLLFGWFKHGGLTGITMLTRRFPEVVQLLNALLAQAAPDAAWTTLALFSSPAAGPHVDRRNLPGSWNYVLPLALPPGDHYLWVQRPSASDSQLRPLSYLSTSGQILSGFQVPLVVGASSRLDPYCLHALPEPLPHTPSTPHVLLVGYSVPWCERAEPSQLSWLQQLGFRPQVGRGGVGIGDNVEGLRSGGVGVGSVGVGSGGVSKSGFEKMSSVCPEEDDCPGLLEVGMTAEGHEQADARDFGGEAIVYDINQDVQEDTAAEGSVTGRGVYARRLEARVFEPASWDRVKQYLTGLGLEHLIGPIDALGVDDIEDFEFLYREDLMEAGASKEEAEAILACTSLRVQGRRGKEGLIPHRWPERDITDQADLRHKVFKVPPWQPGL